MSMTILCRGEENITYDNTLPRRRKHLYNREDIEGRNLNAQSAMTVIRAKTCNKQRKTRKTKTNSSDKIKRLL